MTLLEDINSGKYNLVLILILFVLVFQIHWSKLVTEHMADTNVTAITTDIKDAIRQIYNADVEAIRNLSEVATKLQSGGLTIPGNLTVTGNILSKGDMAVESGNFNLGNKEKDQWIFHAPADDRGGLWISRVQTDGNVNWDNGLNLLTSPDGKQNLGGNINIVPKGTIVSWTGTTAPAGWALCDGANGTGTPDLRGRFVLGLNPSGGKDGKVPGDNYNVINGKGGEQVHTLNVNEMPAHSHAHTAFNANFKHSGGASEGSTKNDNDGSFKVQGDNTGGSQPHNNMPPYYVLAYIMKL